MADVSALRREQNDLRKRLDAIDATLNREQPEREVELGPTVTISVPETGFECPTDDEMRALAELAYGTYDFLEPCSDGMFERAFIAIGHIARADAPNRKISFREHVDNVECIAQQLGLVGPIQGTAVFTALICHSDIAWIAYDSSRGQGIECSLAGLYRIGRPCSNAWRGLLAGKPFVPPLPPRLAPGLAPRGAPVFSVT
jgi:hypothetical protein